MIRSLSVTITVTLLLFDKTVSQKNDGDPCVDRHTNTVGICRPSENCVTAKQDYQLNGVAPTFCEYSAFGNSLVCCRDGKTILQTARPRTADPRPIWSDPNDKRRVSEKKCDAYSRSVISRVDVSILSTGDDGGSTQLAAKCKYTGIELIIGGEDANKGEFPHMAAIGWVNFYGGYDFNCGGSLISTKFVLTAGHCSRDNRAKQPVPALVRLGDQNIDPSVNDGANPIDVPIRHVHPHPEYAPPSKYNDIALLELATDVQFEDTIRPACLWTQEGFGDQNIAVATGWGVVDTVTKKLAKDLQKVSLTLLNNDYCATLLEPTTKWPGFVPSQLCAGELRGGKDTCQGDSGSPLQVANPDNPCIFYIMGVTSFGQKCARSGQPAVYSRVSSFVDWIESVVWPGET